MTRNKGTVIRKNYTRAVVVVHGKSELAIVNHIKSKLRIPIKTKSE